MLKRTGQPQALELGGLGSPVRTPRQNGRRTAQDGPGRTNGPADWLDHGGGNRGRKWGRMTPKVDTRPDAEMGTYRVWVSGYVDIKAWTPAHAEDKASKGIIHYDKSTETFVCLTGPSAYSTTEESPT
jgi:hypothetical protein